MSASSGGSVSLESLNGLPAEVARQRLLACCSSSRWAAEVASGRPYKSVDEILARSDESVAGMTQADLEQALAGHARIGDPSRVGAAGGAEAGPGAAAGWSGQEAAAVAGGSGQAAAAAGWSGQEQAGVRAADQGTVRALAAGNQVYEERFGHIYLVCATGRSGRELLTLLGERLGHDPGTEWEVVRRELGKINQIRLRKLLEGPGELQGPAEQDGTGELEGLRPPGGRAGDTG
jgi:2-oxo-4-hydroxy-4-carboxy-5-ureidoimidazoline decarboxylase